MGVLFKGQSLAKAKQVRDAAREAIREAGDRAVVRIVAALDGVAASYAVVREDLPE